MTQRTSERGAVPPFYAMELQKLASEPRTDGKRVISLALGQPANGAPQVVKDAAIATLRSGPELGYTAANGLTRLREAIAAHYWSSQDVAVDPAHILVTTGSSAGFTAAVLASFDAGDRVAVTRPGYPAYRNVLNTLGCRVLEMECGPQTRFTPTIEMLEALGEPPAGLVLASPSNPTGTIIPAARLAELAAWCADHGTLLLSDEIYHGISFGPSASSALQHTDRAIVIGSFSKYYCMTGWRVGWLVTPAHLTRPTELLLGNLNLSTPTLAQIAAVAAFSEQARAELDGHVARYRANRDLVMRRLPEWGVPEPVCPDGAFYVYPDISHLTDDSLTWCLGLLRETAVSLTPGIDFAPSRSAGPSELDGSRYLRISTAGATEDIDEAFDRIRQWVG